MIKTVGLVMMFLSAIMTGLMYVSRLKERVRLLCALRERVLSFKRRFSVTRPELAELFCDDSNAVTRPVSIVIYEELISGSTPEDAAEKSFSQPYAARLLKSAEREILSGVISSLAGGDIHSVICTLENAADELGTFIGSAREDERKNTKTALALSLYIGLAAVIILM